MRRILVTGGLLALASPLLVLQPIAVGPAYAYPPPGIGWEYHQESKSYYQDVESSEGNPGPARRATRYTDWGKVGEDTYHCPTEYDKSPFECNGNPDGTFCNTIAGVNGLPTAPKVVFERVFEKPDQSDDPAPPWRAIDPPPQDPNHYTPYCQELPDENVVTQDEIRQEVNYKFFQQLGGLTVVVEPKGKTLTNLHTIVHTPYPLGTDIDPSKVILEADAKPKPRITITDVITEGVVQPFRYTIKAEADIVWDFENGDPDGAKGRGRPYEPGLTPSKAPKDYYITTQFLKAGPMSVTVNALWTGTVKVGDYPEQPIAPVPVAGEPFTVQVAQSKTVLGDEK